VLSQSFGVVRSKKWWLLPASSHPTGRSVRAYFKELYMWSCFAKRFTKTAPAPSIELFTELNPPKNSFTGEMEPCQTESRASPAGYLNRLPILYLGSGGNKMHSSSLPIRLPTFIGSTNSPSHYICWANKSGYLFFSSVSFLLVRSELPDSTTAGHLTCLRRRLLRHRKLLGEPWLRGALPRW
jgi:hypothetical protein